jgi:hypothetical protein
MGTTRNGVRGLTLNLILLAAACGGASRAAAPPSPQGTTGAARPAGAARPGPKPYREVVTEKAVSDSGLFTVHRVDDKLLFEIPDSLLGADMLLVSRFAAVPANMGGFLSAGLSVNEQMVRWERQGDQVLLRKYATQAVADDSLPIHISVVSNNFAPILAAFPIQAFSPDSAAPVLDVTEFYRGDTPAISGVTAAQRRTYQVRRLDTARSFINWARSFPLNVNVRRMGRLAESQAEWPEEAYPLVEFLDDVRSGVWGDLSSVTAVDAYRRALQRSYLKRVETLMTEQASARVRDRVTRAHFGDVVERIDAILEGKTPPAPVPAPAAGGAGPPT